MDYLHNKAHFQPNFSLCLQYCWFYFSEYNSCMRSVCWFLHVPRDGDEKVCFIMSYWFSVFFFFNASAPFWLNSDQVAPESCVCRLWLSWGLFFMFQFCMDTVKKFCHTGKHGLILRAGNGTLLKQLCWWIIPGWLNGFSVCLPMWSGGVYGILQQLFSQREFQRRDCQFSAVVSPSVLFAARIWGSH